MRQPYKRSLRQCEVACEVIKVVKQGGVDRVDFHKAFNEQAKHAPIPPALMLRFLQFINEERLKWRALSWSAATLFENASNAKLIKDSTVPQENAASKQRCWVADQLVL